MRYGTWYLVSMSYGAEYLYVVALLWDFVLVRVSNLGLCLFSESGRYGTDTFWLSVTELFFFLRMDHMDIT